MKQRLAGACLSAALLAACAGNGVSSTNPDSAAPQGTHVLASQGAPGRSLRRAGGATMIVLHSFANGPDDGANPYGRLLYFDGNVYGTTANGGADYSGTVYSITPGGSETVLHSFADEPDGANPFSGVVDLDGLLYGTTRNGGIGAGTVYSITPSGSESVVYSFYNGSDGSDPQGGLVAAAGKLYGTTYEGGLYKEGTVFSMSPSGIETVLHSFGASGDGSLPDAQMIHIAGKLYGTTYAGGEHTYGTAFAVARNSGQETLLHSFGQQGDGVSPVYGRLLPLNGTLYGTTRNGGTQGAGTVYSVALTSSGTYNILHSFQGGSEGCRPHGGLVRYKGLLYGTTTGCGSYGHGTIFSIDPASKVLTTVWAFGDQPSGQDPSSDLIVVNDSLYGTTTRGGIHGHGTIFSFKP